jgi:hypothetical protein
LAQLFSVFGIIAWNKAILWCHQARTDLVQKNQNILDADLPISVDEKELGIGDMLLKVLAIICQANVIDICVFLSNVKQPHQELTQLFLLSGGFFF